MTAAHRDYSWNFSQDVFVNFIPSFLWIGAQVQRSELWMCEGSICIMRTPVQSQMSGVGLRYLIVVFETFQIVVERRLETPYVKPKNTRALGYAYTA